MGSPDGTAAPDFAAGVERMRRVLGDEAADAVLATRDRAASRGDAARVEVPVSTTWGWLLDRPGLTPRERIIAMLAVDVARGTTTALGEHVRLALDVGLAPSEVRELLVQLGPYTGYPAVNQASSVINEELAAAPRSPLLPLGPVGRARLGLVVEDARAAAGLLGELIGIERWSVSDLASGSTRARGREVDRIGVVAVGSSPTGLQIELVAPSGGGSSEYRDLLTRGATTHHLGLVEAPVDELEAWVRQLQGQGIEVTVTRWDDAVLAVVDTRADLGYRVAVAGPDFAAVERARATDLVWETPAPDGGPILPPGPDEHVGVVAPDLEQITRGHARVLGRSTWRVLSFDSRRATLTETRLHGELLDDGYLSSVAAVGSSTFELLQPTVSVSRYREAQHDGRSPVHHLYTGHQRGVDAWAPIVERLAQRGHRLAAEGVGWDGGLRYGYVDLRDQIGIDLEIAALEPDALDDAGDAIAFSFHHHDLTT